MAFIPHSQPPRKILIKIHIDQARHYSLSGYIIASHVLGSHMDASLSTGSSTSHPVPA